MPRHGPCGDDFVPCQPLQPIQLRLALYKEHNQNSAKAMTTTIQKGCVTTWLSWCCLILLFCGCMVQATSLTVAEPSLDDFLCIDNATLAAATALENNPVALETLRSWCAADIRCAELYAQDGAPNLPTFVFLFQSTLTVPASSVFLETPLLDNLCNLTVQIFMQRVWVLMLINQILEANVCAVNERFILTPGIGSGGVCVCQPGKTCDNTQTGSFILIIILTVVVILAVVAQFGVVLWNRTRIAQSQAPASTTPQSLVRSTTANTSFPSSSSAASKSRQGGRYRKRQTPSYDM